VKVRWTPEATDNLEQIRRHIEEQNPEAPLRTVRSIFRPDQESIGLSEPMPDWTAGGTRELVLSPLPYFVAYRVQDTTVEILYIRHGARNT
jgi:plasmid stabilization system protein ParE